jgi:hexosaminidase
MLRTDQYIHIGGDEVPKKNWKNCARCQARMKQEGLKDEHELQSYFIRRIEKWINAQGRTLIGWSEIREGGLAQNAVVMDWIGGAVEAATAGHDVIMSPTKFCYLDYYQSTNHATEPKAIGGYLPLSKVYSFEPLPEKLDSQFQSHISGAQGNLWTEYIPNFKQAQYMVFPRLSALAEVTWSAQASRNWEDFTRRLQTQFQRFDQVGVNYRKGTERISE